jgi:hypothetical protein
LLAVWAGSPGGLCQKASFRALRSYVDFVVRWMTGLLPDVIVA